MEGFTHPRLQGTLTKFYVLRSDLSAGPFTVLIDSVDVGVLNEDGLYEYEDEDQTFKVGETKFYAVTSVDNLGKQSGRTNFTEHTKKIAAVAVMDEVHAVPNPLVIKSGFTGIGEDDKIGFYGLPKRATIRIYNFGGQLVETIEHDEDSIDRPWFQVTRNNQEIASGVYLFVVTTPDGDVATGKFIVVK